MKIIKSIQLLCLFVFTITMFNGCKKNENPTVNGSSQKVLSTVYYKYDLTTLKSDQSYTLSKSEFEDAEFYTLGNYIHDTLQVHSYIIENKTNHNKSVVLKLGDKSIIFYTVDAAGIKSKTALKVEENVGIKDSFSILLIEPDWESMNCKILATAFVARDKPLNPSNTKTMLFKKSEEDPLDEKSQNEFIDAIRKTNPLVWVMTIRNKPSFQGFINTFKNSIDDCSNKWDAAKKEIESYKTSYEKWRNKNVMQPKENAEDKSDAIKNDKKDNLFWALLRDYNSYNFTCVNGNVIDIGCMEPDGYLTLSFKLTSKYLNTPVWNKEVEISVPSNNKSAHIEDINGNENLRTIIVRTDQNGIAKVDWFPGSELTPEVNVRITAIYGHREDWLTINGKKGTIDVLSCPVEMCRILNLTGWQVKSLNIKTGNGLIVFSDADYPITGIWSDYEDSNPKCGLLLSQKIDVANATFNNSILEVNANTFSSYWYRHYDDCSLWTTNNFAYNIINPSKYFTPVHTVLPSYGYLLANYNTSSKVYSYPNSDYKIQYYNLTENYGHMKVTHFMNSSISSDPIYIAEFEITR